MDNALPFNYLLRRHVEVICVLLCLFSCAKMSYGDHAVKYFKHGPRYKSTVVLSDKAAKLVAEHLATVMQLLRDGGPSPNMPKTNAVNWTVEKEIGPYANHSGGYTKEQYLSDYRAEFIRSWTINIREQVEELPNGVFQIREGSKSVMRNFPTPGAQAGYGAPQFLLQELRSKEAVDSTTSDDENKRERAPTPQTDAIMWLYQHVIQDNHDSPVHLSKDTTKIVAEHLAKAIQLFKEGGPPSHLSKEDVAKWKIEDSIGSYKQRDGSKYSHDQYLADYRAEFLQTWHELVNVSVDEEPKGTFR